MITQPTEEYFKDGGWGWDGTRWRKNNLLFGYVAAIGQDLVNADLDAGTNTLSGTAVPAGEVWVVTLVALRYDGTAPSLMWIRPSGLPGNPPIHVVSSVASLQWYPQPTWVVLEAGDKLEGVVLEATATDAFYARYCGYKMQVT